MTRASIKIFDNDKLLVHLYMHSDGYPSGPMQDVAEKYMNYRLVDGIPMGEQEIFNGMGDLAIRVITDLKNQNIKDTKRTLDDLKKFMGIDTKQNMEAGWLYVVEPEGLLEFTDFDYEIRNDDDKIFIKCTSNGVDQFNGTFAEFYEWSVKESEEE